MKFFIDLKQLKDNGLKVIVNEDLITIHATPTLFTLTDIVYEEALSDFLNAGDHHNLSRNIMEDAILQAEVNCLVAKAITTRQPSIPIKDTPHKKGM